MPARRRLRPRSGATPPSKYTLGRRHLFGDEGARLLFTNNETHAEGVYGSWAKSRSRFVKDAFHRHIVGGENCVKPDRTGTKACLHYTCAAVAVGGSMVVRLRLTNTPLQRPLEDVDAIVRKRRQEADAFYKTLHPLDATAEGRSVQRQALAGMIWSKQIYLFNVHLWLNGDNPACPPPESRLTVRNVHWRHLNSMRILTMPDKWEYPGFSAWDLASQSVTFALIDPEFAKEQLWLLLFEQFQHPNGQIPAYEWEFSDLNPPIHAWAVWRVHNMERLRTGRSDRRFLEMCFQKLLMNFAS